MATAEIPPLTLLGEAFLADPHAVIATHRRSSAAVYDDVWQVWVALRYREAAEILRDPSYRKDPESALDGPYTQTLLATERTMLFMDDPDHRRLRGLVAQAFTKRSTEALR